MPAHAKKLPLYKRKTPRLEQRGVTLIGTRGD